MNKSYHEATVHKNAMKLYKQYRKPAFSRYGDRRMLEVCSSSYAWREAKQRARVEYIFGRLEYKGLVALRVEPDDYYDMDDLKGDIFNPNFRDDIKPEVLKREEEEFEERVHRMGVYGIIAEYRKDENAKWEHADSCCGFIGDDWSGSGYDIDLMSSAIDALLGIDHQQGELFDVLDMIFAFDEKQAA